MRRRMWRLALRRRWCILMILGRRTRWISIFLRRPLNLLARRRRRALVLLGRGLRNRKTIARAICPTPIRMDGAPQSDGLEKEVKADSCASLRNDKKKGRQRRRQKQ